MVRRKRVMVMGTLRSLDNASKKLDLGKSRLRERDVHPDGLTDYSAGCRPIYITTIGMTDKVIQDR